MPAKKVKDTKSKPVMSFEAAKARYVHRYTMEHKPLWAEGPAPSGLFYAPQYSSDREWYDCTIFPPHNHFSRSDCHSGFQTWPVGQWLDRPFRVKVKL